MTKNSWVDNCSNSGLGKLSNLLKLIKTSYKLAKKLHDIVMVSKLVSNVRKKSEASMTEGKKDGEGRNFFALESNGERKLFLLNTCIS